MMKTNPMVLEMLQKQMPGVAPETIVKGLDWLASIAIYYGKTRTFFANKYVQLVMMIAIVYAVFWYFG